jgi:uncharacterized protein
MTLSGEQILLRAWLQSADRSPHVPTYERLLRAARDSHLAGATVLRGILGAGHTGILRPAAISIVRHEPVILEIVDSPEKIAAFLQGPVDELLTHGLLTLERANVIMYRQRKHDHPNQFKLASPVEPLSTLPPLNLRSPHMQTQQSGILLRVFTGESDRHDNQPLHEAIIQKIRQLGLAGATVLRGSEGFGANSVVHKSSLLDMSSDLPIVTEIVDTKDKIDTLLPHLESMVQEGMITMEYVQILLYRHNPADAKS